MPRETKTLQELLSKYLKHLEISHYSIKTLTNRRKYIGYFLDWCGTQEPVYELPNQIDPEVFEHYKAYLYRYLKADGTPLTQSTQAAFLSAVKNFFSWLVKKNHLIYNPASELVLPRVDKRLPRVILTADEVERIMSQPDTKTRLGVRDRSILETFYSTGMRRVELRNLKVSDLDFERGTVLIRNAKNKRDRVIPIGERALYWINRYLNDIRPLLVRHKLPDQNYLFIGQVANRPFRLHTLTEIVSRYIKQADIGKRGSCHLFRHAMATLMLENGADIRYIQEMLGHVTIESTQIYTRVAIKKLKEVHEQSHPGNL